MHTISHEWISSDMLDLPFAYFEILLDKARSYKPLGNLLSEQVKLETIQKYISKLETSNIQTFDPKEQGSLIATFLDLNSIINEYQLTSLTFNIWRDLNSRSMIAGLDLFVSKLPTEFDRLELLYKNSFGDEKDYTDLAVLVLRRVRRVGTLRISQGLLSERLFSRLADIDVENLEIAHMFLTVAKDVRLSEISDVYFSSLCTLLTRTKSIKRLKLEMKEAVWRKKESFGCVVLPVDGFERLLSAVQVCESLQVSLSDVPF